MKKSQSQCVILCTMIAGGASLIVACSKVYGADDAPDSGATNSTSASSSSSGNPADANALGPSSSTTSSTSTSSTSSSSGAEQPDAGQADGGGSIPIDSGNTGTIPNGDPCAVDPGKPKCQSGICMPTTAGGSAGFCTITCSDPGALDPACSNVLRFTGKCTGQGYCQINNN